MINFTQKWIENLFISKIIRAYLFVPHLCLMLSEVQHGEPSQIRCRHRWISQTITPHPLCSSDSVSCRKELFQPDLFPFGNHSRFGIQWLCLAKDVLCVMPWLLCQGQPQDPSLSTSLFWLTRLWKSRYVQACEEMIHLAHCEGRCEKFEEKDCFYIKFNTNFIENH